MKIGEVFGWFGAIVTVFLGLPQLIKIIRDKKVGKVRFLSFWVFHWGLFAWILFGSFLKGSLIQVAISNLLCLYIYTAVVFSLYYYRDYTQLKFEKKPTLIKVSIILAIFAIVSTASMIYGQIPGSYKLDNKSTVSIIIGGIVPSFTCLAFMPQIIYSFKTRNFAGISIYMILMFILNNIFWITYWTSIYTQESSNAIIMALCWQVFSTVIFGTQFICTLMYYINLKKQGIKKSL